MNARLSQSILPLHDKLSTVSSYILLHDQTVKLMATTVEVCLKTRAATRFDTIRGLIHTYVTSFERIGLPSILSGWEDIPELSSSVDRVVACEIAGSSSTLTQDQMMLQIHVYQPLESDSFEEFSPGSRNDEDDTMATTVSELPNRNWNGLWDSLIYDNDIKMKLLDYIHATLVFSDANVDCEHRSFFSFCHIPNPTST